MKISELIEALEKIKTESGDIKVETQNRDDGGDYDGSQEIDLKYFEITKEKLILA